MQIRVVCMAATIFLVSCNKSVKHDIILNKNTILFSNFLKEENASFDTLFEYTKGDPRSIRVVDSTLIIANKSRNTDHFFYKYSLAGQKLSTGFLAKGRGPNEAIGIYANGINDNTIWGYDITLKKVMTTNIENILDDKDKISFNSYPVKRMYSKMRLIDSLRVLAVNLDRTDFRMEVLDLVSGKKIKELGKFYKLPDDVPMTAAKGAYSAEIYLKPSGNKVAVAYNNTDVLEIYNLKTDSSFAVKGPAGFDVAFDIDKNKDFYYMRSNAETRHAFSNGAVTDKYIYLLYSGHQRQNHSMEDRYKWNHAKYVHVYDWNGTPVKKITLDTYINAFGISQDGKTIYSFNDKTGYIIKANLN